jgi:ketol-acid reductoisomerase
MNIKEENQPEESGHEVSQPYAMISHLIDDYGIFEVLTSIQDYAQFESQDKDVCEHHREEARTVASHLEVLLEQISIG